MSEDQKAKRFKAIGPNKRIDVICKRHAGGEIPVCPRCDNELIVAFSWAEARKHSAHPGVFCPADAKHFQVLFNVGPRKGVNPGGSIPTSD